MKTLFLSLLLISSSAFADEWRTEDTYREVGFQVLNIIDWGQTRYAAQNPNRFKEVESAWIIGEHPSVQTVDNYMAATAVLHYGTTRALLYFDLRYIATTFQYVTIGIKLNSATVTLCL